MNLSVKLVNIPVFFYVFTALSAQWIISLIGASISDEAMNVIYLSVIPVLLVGLLPQIFKLPKITFKSERSSYNNIYIYLARFFMILGLLSVSLNFFMIGGIPLFSGNSIREIFTASVLWNIFIFCSVGLFMEGYRLRHFRSNYFNKILLYLYIASSILTGWKAAFINFSLMYLVSRYPDLKISVPKIVGILLLVGALFLIMNFLRAGGGDLGLEEIFLYMYWGFVNFSNIAFQEKSDCLYTNFFDNCKFVFDNQMLENPTWNVFTALTPIYIDGGSLYIFLYFTIASAFFLYAGRVRGSIGFSYMRYIVMYFIFIAHNGYYFNSKAGLISLIFMLFIDIFLRYSRRKSNLYY